MNNTIDRHKRILVIVAGVNGAGKSTAYETDPNITHHIHIINPDVYAKKCANKAGYNSINDLPISIQKEVNIKSGKLALQKREAALSLGISFGIETTASSNATSRLIDKAHNANYLVKMVYVMLSNVNLHLQRVSIRVKTGGHYVSPEDIRRRFERAEKIFPQLMKKADQVTVYDNTDGYQLVLVKEKGRYRIFPCREEVRIRLETALKEIQTEKTNITNRNNCDIER